MKQAPLDPCDRAAAGPDRAHVDPRGLQRHADDLALVLHARPAVDQQAGVEARAADVRGDRKVEIELRAQAARPDGAGDRS